MKATIDWGDLPVNWSPKAFRWEFDFVFTPDFVELESGTERHFSKDGKMIKEYFHPDQPYIRLGPAFIILTHIGKSRKLFPDFFSDFAILRRDSGDFPGTISR